MKFIYGLIFFFLGAAIIKYRKNVYEWTGRFVWAERYLGSGGTVLVIILAGCLLIFLSVAYPMGAVNPQSRAVILEQQGQPLGQTANTSE
ncbi:MAG TPA: hypothetical protein PK765_06080 [bacterium]|nr:hypothetical protein [bacterium]